MAQASGGSFLELAERLGQSTERLKAGEAVQTVVQINSLDEFKELFGDVVDGKQREEISKDHLLRHADGLKDSTPFTRLIDHVYGTAALSAEDAAIVEQMLPIKVLVQSVTDMNVTKDMIYGPSASPVMLNVGTLTFNGGSIITENTVLTLKAETVAFGATPGARPYHIGILGVDGATGAKGSDGAGPNPSQANSGSNAHRRSPGVCTGVGDGGVGSNGADGNKGSDGGAGGDGKPNLPATITIGQFSASDPGDLVLYSRSGAGGAGGNGGQGGAGQKGGNGGNGCDSGCEGTDGGNSGNGGKGGNGGNGGQGGNGVNGFNITVTVPDANLKNVQTSTEVAPYGQGGFKGAGGAGGDPGVKGKGGKGCSDGKAGVSGNQGDSGDAGKNGVQQGSPGQFYVNAS